MANLDKEIMHIKVKSRLKWPLLERLIRHIFQTFKVTFSKKMKLQVSGNQYELCPNNCKAKIKIEEA